MEIKKQKGVTLIALIITIVVLLIIAGISLQGVKIDKKETENNKLETELDMVQHAVLERYTKYSLTKDTDLLVGTKIDNIQDKLPGGEKWKIETPEASKPEEQYYELTPQELSELGLKNSEDTYIVNYKTGEVFNESKQKTSEGKLLYTYAIENTIN